MWQAAHILDLAGHDRAIKIRPESDPVRSDATDEIINMTNNKVERRVVFKVAIGANIIDGQVQSDDPVGIANCIELPIS